MPCLFCNSAAHVPAGLPPTAFNGTRFEYVRCSACRLIYVDPLPGARDFAAMYPPDYQSGVDTTLLSDLTKKIPGLHFSYQSQFDLLKGQRRLADYGCGDGHFISNALQQSYECTGVEFDREQVRLLAEKIPAAQFFTEDDFLASSERYPIIRMSNVLEHLTQPVEQLAKLIAKLEPGGLLLIEGPIENNFNLSFLVRRLYLLARRSRVLSDPPLHIFQSDRFNQRAMLQRAGLEELHFEVREFPWPFPETLAECNSMGMRVKYLIGAASSAVSRVVPGWGNTFLYLGRKATR